MLGIYLYNFTAQLIKSTSSSGCITQLGIIFEKKDINGQPVNNVISTSKHEIVVRESLDKLFFKTYSTHLLKLIIFLCSNGNFQNTDMLC